MKKILLAMVFGLVSFGVLAQSEYKPAVNQSSQALPGYMCQGCGGQSAPMPQAQRMVVAPSYRLQTVPMVMAPSYSNGGFIGYSGPSYIGSVGQVAPSYIGSAHW